METEGMVMRHSWRRMSTRLGSRAACCHPDEHCVCPVNELHIVVSGQQGM